MVNFIKPNDIGLTLDMDLYDIYFPTLENFTAYETRAIDLAKSYLSQRADLTATFIRVADWTAGAYDLDAYVYHNENFWKSLAADNTDEPTALSLLWEISDPRNAQMVSIISDLMLFDAASKTQTREISDVRTERYKYAVKWLKDFSEGKIGWVNLPISTETTAVPSFLYGTDLNLLGTSYY